MLTVAVITMFSLLLSSASIRASTVSGVVGSSRSSMAKDEEAVAVVTVPVAAVAVVAALSSGTVESQQVGRRTVEWWCRSRLYRSPRTSSSLSSTSANCLLNSMKW